MSLQYKFKNKMLNYQVVKIDLPLENVNKHHMQKLAQMILSLKILILLVLKKMIKIQEIGKQNRINILVAINKKMIKIIYLLIKI